MFYLYSRVKNQINPTHIIVLEWHQFRNNSIRQKFYQHYGKNIMFWEKSFDKINPYGNFNQERDLRIYGRTEFENWEMN